MRKIFLNPLIILLFLLASCDFGPNSGRGFSLPEGDVEKGRATFVELGCNTCHSVGDIEHVARVEEPDINIRLGGKVSVVKTYGDLVTSVINPSHKINRHYTKMGIATDENGLKMDVYNEFMTVQQLVDLVTYLESNYQIVPARRTAYTKYRIKDH